MLREPFQNEEIYHIYNRGVDKRIVFENNNDYLNFLLRLSTFNDKQNLFHSKRKLSFNEAGVPYTDILMFSLLPNHFHLLVTNKEQYGVSKLMQRLLNGYTKYFNIKNDRSGSLFEGAYQCKHVNSDAYLNQIVRYIGLNHLDQFQIDWKTGIPKKQIKRAERISREYTWSSTSDYLRKNRFPFLNQKTIDKVTNQNMSSFLFLPTSDVGI